MVVHIITACHNRIGTTQKFIASLQKQTYPALHLILVDDGSTDGTSEMVKAQLPDATIIRGDGNLWWGGALHEAYKWIRDHHFPVDDAVFFTNDDNIFKDEYLAEAVEKLKKHKNTLIVGNGFNIHTGEQCDGVSHCNLKTGDIRLLDTNSTGNLASTRALLMRVDDLLKIGGFHPILLPHYLSDYEFVIRASKKGFKIRTYENLCFDYDRSMTGVKDYKKLTPKILFSKRCPYNPIYKVNYLLMITPLKYLPSRIWNQIRNYKKQIEEWKKL